MSKVFVEYQILPQHRSVYSIWIQNVIDKNPKLELLEGVDQPGLFIEVWDGLTREAFDRMKKMRKYDTDLPPSESKQPASYIDVDWRRLDVWIQGGVSKINIWHFYKVR
jgi:hypothetical protein